MLPVPLVVPFCEQLPLTQSVPAEQVWPFWKVPWQKPLHTWFAAQMLVQLPQWLTSVCVLRQTPLQFVVLPLVGQQTLPAAPPCWLGTQVLPVTQSVGAAQAPFGPTLPPPEQTPLLQVCGALHTLPQLPQLSLSDCVLTQLPPQLVEAPVAAQQILVPPLAGATQLPLWQLPLVVQVLPFAIVPAQWKFCPKLPAVP